MIATKEQERKALEKIRKIVEELGEDSYIGTAFEGCFEVAEENIENDFACSMKQRAESAEKAMHASHNKVSELKTELKKAQDTISKLNSELEAAHKARPTIEDFETCISLARAAASENKNNAELQAELIVGLADTPDCPPFAEAVRKNRAYAKAALQAEKLAENLRYYMEN